MFIQTGRLVSGDCKKNIHVWEPQEGGTSWQIDQRPFSSHSKSVEDLQWSPTEATVSYVLFSLWCCGWDRGGWGHWFALMCYCKTTEENISLFFFLTKPKPLWCSVLDVYVEMRHVCYLSSLPLWPQCWPQSRWSTTAHEHFPSNAEDEFTTSNCVHQCSTSVCSCYHP